MRILFLIVSVFFYFINVKNSNLLKDIDNKIYDQYINDFKEYLYLDDSYELKIDKDKFKNDMSSNLYEIIIKDDCNFNFEVHFKYVFSFDEKYYFYLEKNYDN